MQTGNAPAKHSPERLVQIDSLRAIAALSVVAFHYTTRYEQVFMHSDPIGASFARGAMGVPLFFVISGFVIFMTIDRARRPLDFVVWRFSRLYPAYWAAALLTWVIVTLAALPGHQISVRDLFVNLTMLQFFLTIQDVDGVYWSLQVELVFYAWMLFLWVTGWLRRATAVCIAWVGLALAAALAQRLGWVHVPYVPGYFLLLGWIPWFAMGMVTYLTLRDGRFERGHGVVIGLSLVTVAVGMGLPELGIAALSAVAVYFASRGRVRVLEWKPLVFVGLISYPLYLLHENIGFVVIAALEQAGMGGWLAIGCAVVAALTLATLLHTAVEGPGSKALRGIYKRWQAKRAPAAFSRPRWAVGCLAVLCACALALMVTARAHRASEQQRPSLTHINPVPAQSSPAACHQWAGKRPYLVIALGQSNAGSHAEPAPNPARVPVFTPAGCAWVTDPLPATTGSGASIWSALPQRLRSHRNVEIIVAPLAVESTRIEHWLDPDLGLLRRLDTLLAAARDSGIPVLAVLWQQGESDAKRGTEARHYRRRLRELRRVLDTAGIEAPLLVAKSTWVAGNTNLAIRHAIDAAVARDERILPGPDTDRLGRGFRLHGSHFNRAGRNAAALQWAEALGHLLAAAPPRPDPAGTPRTAAPGRAGPSPAPAPGSR